QFALNNFNPEKTGQRRLGILPWGRMTMISRRFLTAGFAATALSGPPARGATGPGPWPDGARAAVSLTYDDGLDSQLDHALPALEAAGLKATFFLTHENVGARTPDWVRAASPA